VLGKIINEYTKKITSEQIDKRHMPQEQKVDLATKLRDEQGAHLYCPNSQNIC
jgi:hypothetical protein